MPDSRSRNELSLQRSRNGGGEMGQLGLHLRVTDEELAHIEGLSSEAEIDEYLVEELEELKFESGDVAETDKSWAYIHSALMGADPDGPLERSPTQTLQQNQGFLKRLFGTNPIAPAPWIDNGPAKYAIVGFEDVVSSEAMHLGLSRKGEVTRIAQTLQEISTEDLKRLVMEAHRRFDAAGDADEAADYAASWYEGLVEFYRRSAEVDQHVIFSVSF